MTQISSPTTTPPAGSKVVIVALALAVLTVVLNAIYINNVHNQVALDSFDVYRLKNSVESGREVDNRDLELVKVPNSFKPAFEGYVTGARLTNLLAAKQKYSVSVSANSILNEAHFSAEGTSLVPIEQLVKKGNRVIAVPVNTRVQLPLKPGMFVDLSIPMQSGGMKSTMVVLENVKVLGLDRAQGTYRTISIEATPRQAATLTDIRDAAAGDFELWVRNQDDRSLTLTNTDPDTGINKDVLEVLEKRQARPASSASTP